jgi:hypothetical protein
MKPFVLSPLTLVVILPALAPLPATALSISSFTEVTAVHTRFPDATVETDSGTRPAVLSAEVVTPLHEVMNTTNSGPGRARADAGPLTSDLSYSNVYVEGINNDSIHEFPQSLTAVVEQTWTVTPTDPSTYYPVYYSFEIFNQFVEIWDGYGLSNIGTDNVQISLDYEILLDGIDAFTYYANVTGTADMADLYVSAETTELGTGAAVRAPVGFATEVPSDGASVRVTFDDVLREDLFLGTVMADCDTTPDTFLVEAKLRASMFLPRFALDAGGLANIGDPSVISPGATGTLRIGSPTEPPLVPLPGGLGLLAGGLALLAARRVF